MVRSGQQGSRQPARRVIFGSLRARIARFAIGLVLLGVTLYIVWPVLASDHGAPREQVAVSIATNWEPGEEAHSRERGPSNALQLTVTANGCKNPARIEGSFEISDSAWVRSEEGGSPPREAMVAFAGPARTLIVGLSATPYPELPYFNITHGTVKLHSLPIPVKGKPHRYYDELVVKNELFPVRRLGDVTAAYLRVLGWPDTRSALDFVIEANLIHPAGFDSCYVDLPIASGYSDVPGANATERLLSQPPPVPDRHGAVPFIGELIGAAEVNVSVHGRTVVGSSLNRYAEVDGDGARYTCGIGVSEEEAVEGKAQSEDASGRPPLIAANCAGTPLFAAVDATSESTRRLFAAGIIGAIAATLMVEALFVGETVRKRRDSDEDTESAGDVSSS